MRRSLLVPTVLVLGLPAFGLGLAYGGGGTLHFNTVGFDGVYSSVESRATSAVTVTSQQFFDLTYAMVEVGYTLTRASTEPTTVSTATGFATVLTGVSFSTFLKYPIALGPVAVYPILGAEYVWNLSYTDDKGNNLKADADGSTSLLNELWLKGGVGADISLGSVFLRPIVLAGFKPLSPGATQRLTSTDKKYGTYSLTIALSSFTVDVALLFGSRI